MIVLQELCGETMEGYSESLALFYQPATENGIESIYWTDIRPFSQISDSGSIDFTIPGNSQYYIDLKKTRLHIKFKILNNDGTGIKEGTDDVTPVNNLLHSMFSQQMVTIGQEAISSGVGRYHPYKSILDILLNSNNEKQKTVLSSQLFYKDSPTAMDQSKTNISPYNEGLSFRHQLVKSGGIVDMEGPLSIDFFQQERLLLNGVPVSIKLYQSNDSFRLMSAKPDYKINITDAVLHVCYVRVSPGVLLGHAETLKEHPAKYYYNDSEIKTFEIGKGQYSYTTDNFFHGKIPSELYIALAPAQAVNGSYMRNPFNFKHYNLTLCSLTINGQRIFPYLTDFKTSNFVSAYMSLFQKTPNISKEEFKSGYTIYVYDLEKQIGGLRQQEKHGQSRLELRFADPLPQTVTLFLYGRFPRVLNIGGAREVTTQP